MSANTKIEWADHTFNPWIGCTKVSPGCDHCYAEAREDTRLHRVKWGPGQPRHRTKTWGDPVKWNAQHATFFAEHGRRQRVFCASLADVFDNEVDPGWRAELFALIDQTPHLDWLLLTKRIGNVPAMLAAPGMQKCGLPPNVWLGATIVNQEEADRDLPKLLTVPACIRFLSIEPMLGPITLRAVQHDGMFEVDALTGDHGVFRPLQGRSDTRLDWVIVGGESGPGARPMHPDWARDLRDECQAAGVPFLFKQWGEWLPAMQDGARDRAVIEINASDAPMRVGKKASGRALDGRTWDEVPS